MLAQSKISIRTKLACLWTSIMFLYVYADYFDGMTPSSKEMSAKLETPVGPLTPELLMIFSSIMIVPSLMICLSVILKPKFSKYLNIIIASIWSIMSIVLFKDTVNSEWHNFYALFQVIEFFLLVFIVWLAIKWPKIEE